MCSLRRALRFDPYGNLLVERSGERLLKLLSPAYLINKLKLIRYETTHPDFPWITQTATVAFDALLRPTHHGLEWGSGNGSIWIAQRCAALVSIEHHRAWYDKVSSKLRERGIGNVDYRLVEEGQYLAPIDEFQDETLDFVVVDGLFRDGAFLRSMPKVREGGFILFDNVNWYLPSDSTTPHSRTHAQGPATPLFGQVIEQLRTWKTIWTTNGVNDTAIFVKPTKRSAG